MLASCHGSKKTVRTTLKTPNLAESPRNPDFAILLGRLCRQYFWMQTESVTLKPCLGAQLTTRTPAATPRDDCMRQGSWTSVARCCLSARQCTQHSALRTHELRSPFAGNCWTIDCVVLTLSRLTLISLRRWSNTIMREWKFWFRDFRTSAKMWQMRQRVRDYVERWYFSEIRVQLMF